jgi:hypothetical protein
MTGFPIGDSDKMGSGRDLRPPRGPEQRDAHERLAAARQMLAAIDATVFPDDDALPATDLAARIRRAVLRLLGHD